MLNIHPRSHKPKLKGLLCIYLLHLTCAVLASSDAQAGGMTTPQHLVFVGELDSVRLSESAANRYSNVEIDPSRELLRTSNSCGFEEIQMSVTQVLYGSAPKRIEMLHKLTESCHSTWEKGSQILVFAKWVQGQVIPKAILELDAIDEKMFVLMEANQAVDLLPGASLLKPLPQPVELEYPITFGKGHLEKLAALGAVTFELSTKDLRDECTACGPPDPVWYYKVTVVKAVPIDQIRAVLKSVSVKWGY